MAEIKRADGNGRVWRDRKCAERTSGAYGEGLLFSVAVRFLFFVEGVRQTRAEKRRERGVRKSSRGLGTEMKVSRT